MNMETRIVFLSIIIMAAGMWASPLFSRRGVFFGVTVDPEFRMTGDARRIVLRFRQAVMAVTALAIASLWIAAPHLSGLQWAAATVIFVLVQFLAGVGALAVANRQTRAFAAKLSSERTASLEPRANTLPGGWPLLAGPMLIVIAAGAAVFARRDSMTAETFRGSMSMLLVAFISDLLLTGLAALGALRTRRINGSDRKGLRYFPQLVTAYGFTAFGVGPALSTAGMITPVLRIALFAMGSITAIALVFLIVYQLRAMSNQSPTDNTPDECWSGGVFYYNPDDPAFLVEKRIGFGWTLNYANKWSWVCSIAILAAPLVIRLFWFR
jgi:uncharacterized membrane protein